MRADKAQRQFYSSMGENMNDDKAQRQLVL
jgi:hypothetical protein